MYIAVFVIVGLLIFPIITTLYFFIDKANKKLFFGIYLFGKIKILSAYFKTRNKDSVYLHISNSKAIIIDFSIFKKMGGNFELHKILNIDLFELYIESGLFNSSLTIIMLYVYNLASSFSVILNNDYGMRLNVHLILSNSNSINSLAFKIRVQFNVFCIVINFIANIITIGVKNVKRKRSRLKKWNFKFS